MMGLSLTLSAPLLAQVPSNPELKPCRVAGIKTEVLCGVLQRALDPAQPSAVKIDIHYVVVPALARAGCRVRSVESRGSGTGEEEAVHVRRPRPQHQRQRPRRQARGHRCHGTGWRGVGLRQGSQRMAEGQQSDQ